MLRRRTEIKRLFSDISASSTCVLQRWRSLAPILLFRSITAIALSVLLFRRQAVGLFSGVCTGIEINLPGPAASETATPWRSTAEATSLLFVNSSGPFKGKSVNRHRILSHCRQNYNEKQRRARLKLLSYRVPAPALKYNTPSCLAVGRSRSKPRGSGLDKHSNGNLEKPDHKDVVQSKEMQSCRSLTSEWSQTSRPLAHHSQHPRPCLDAAKMDPFSTTSAPITPDIQFLLEFCRCMILTHRI